MVLLVCYKKLFPFKIRLSLEGFFAHRHELLERNKKEVLVLINQLKRAWKRKGVVIFLFPDIRCRSPPGLFFISHFKKLEDKPK